MTLNVFHCEFPGCERTFNTTTGRGVHHQRAHRAWYDHQTIQGSKRARWTVEEISLLARREAELTTHVRNINQALQESFPERSLEGIKGQRRLQGYKDAVQRFIVELQTGHPSQEATHPPSQHSHRAPCRRPPEGPIRLLNYIRSLRALSTDDYQARRLENIIEMASNNNREGVFQSLSVYLRDILRATPPPSAATRRVPVQPTSRKIQRRRDYARTQRHWKKCRSRCIRSILDNVEDSVQPPRERMEPYWSTVFTQPATNSRPTLQQRPGLEGIWEPITPGDIKAALPSTAVSSGPDGLTARQLRAVPIPILTRIANLILWCGKLPDHLSLSKTTFIPKKAQARQPGEFRPISVSSVLTRLVHKILAQRIDTAICLDDQQRAFRRGIDGCRDNTILLDAVLRSRFAAHKSLYLGNIDIAKAFDSVQHPALLAAGKAAGLPPELLDYLEDYYAKSATTLIGSGWQSDPLRVTRGVRQGDPLSPVLFNIVMDHLLRSYPQETGVRFNDTSIRAMAFADDLVLLADSPPGLQDLLQTTTAYLQECGMVINTAKSHTVSIQGMGHVKKAVVDAGRTFKINGQPVRALSREDTWTYLGLEFSPEGRRRSLLASKVSKLLHLLTKAPLKPQQRLFALRTTALPSVYYHMALGRVTVGELTKADKMVRASIRQWLALPNDTPNGYFHATVGEGGLGIPSLRWLAPLHRRDRLQSYSRGFDVCEEYLRLEIAACEKRLTDQGVPYLQLGDLQKRWANLLHKSIEGSPMKASESVAGQHQWVADGTRLLTGRDYIHCHHVRIGALPSRSRTTRGRRGDRLCRAGCAMQETNNHILQVCDRTHNIRIKRHNAVVSYVARNLRRQGFTVTEEPHFQTIEGIRKPDLLGTMGCLGVVLDAQIVGERADTERARRIKISKYSDNPDIDLGIKRAFGVTTVLHLPIILSCRGVWNKQSVHDLLQLGVVNRRDVAVITTRVLIGGYAAFTTFNRRTR